MAVPKRRTSKHRKRIRRSHLRIPKPALSSCTRCGSVKKSHAICDACGHYDGVEVIPKPLEP